MAMNDKQYSESKPITLCTTSTTETMLIACNYHRFADRVGGMQARVWMVYDFEGNSIGKLIVIRRNHAYVLRCTSNWLTMKVCWMEKTTIFWQNYPRPSHTVLQSCTILYWFNSFQCWHFTSHKSNLTFSISSFLFSSLLATCIRSIATFRSMSNTKRRNCMW